MTDRADPPAGAPRRMRLALYASLAVNLLFVGIVGGAILHGPPERGGMMGRELGFGPFTEALSPADRMALMEAFRRSGGSPREMRQAMRADLAEFIRVLRASPSIRQRWSRRARRCGAAASSAWRWASS